MLSQSMRQALKMIGTMALRANKDIALRNVSLYVCYAENVYRHSHIDLSSAKMATTMDQVLQY